MEFDAYSLKQAQDLEILWQTDLVTNYEVPRLNTVLGLNCNALKDCRRVLKFATKLFMLLISPTLCRSTVRLFDNLPSTIV